MTPSTRAPSLAPLLALAALSLFAGCSSPVADDAESGAESATSAAGEALRPFPADFHEQCTSGRRAHTPACTAAAHRLCNAAGYGGGMVLTSDGIMMMGRCFTPLSYFEASYGELAAKNEGCNRDDTQSDGCYAAARRLCVDRHGVGAGGLIQEVGESGAAVACFAAEPAIQVNAAKLRDYGLLPDVASYTQQLRDRYAASAYCAEVHHANGGLVQEMGPSDFLVACIKAQKSWSTNFRR